MDIIYENFYQVPFPEVGSHDYEVILLTNYPDTTSFDNSLLFTDNELPRDTLRPFDAQIVDIGAFKFIDSEAGDILSIATSMPSINALTTDTYPSVCFSNLELRVSQNAGGGIAAIKSYVYIYPFNVFVQEYDNLVYTNGDIPNCKYYTSPDLFIIKVSPYKILYKNGTTYSEVLDIGETIYTISSIGIIDVIIKHVKISQQSYLTNSLLQSIKEIVFSKEKYGHLLYKPQTIHNLAMRFNITFHNSLATNSVGYFFYRPLNLSVIDTKVEENIYGYIFQKVSPFRIMKGIQPISIDKYIINLSTMTEISYPQLISKVFIFNGFMNNVGDTAFNISPQYLLFQGTDVFSKHNVGIYSIFTDSKTNLQHGTYLGGNIYYRQTPYYITIYFKNINVSYSNITYKGEYILTLYKSGVMDVLLFYLDIMRNPITQTDPYTIIMFMMRNALQNVVIPIQNILEGSVQIRNKAYRYNMSPYTIDGLKCFYETVNILTSTGYRNVSELKKNDRVITPNGRFVKIVDIQKIVVANTPEFYPYVIPKDYFREFVPNREILLSANHSYFDVLKGVLTTPIRSKMECRQIEGITDLVYYNFRLERKRYNEVDDRFVIADGLVCETDCIDYTRRDL